MTVFQIGFELATHRSDPHGQDQESGRLHRPPLNPRPWQGWCWALLHALLGYAQCVNALIPPARDLCQNTNPKQEGVKVFYKAIVVYKSGSSSSNSSSKSGSSSSSSSSSSSAMTKSGISSQSTNQLSCTMNGTKEVVIYAGHPPQRKPCFTP